MNAIGEQVNEWVYAQTNAQLDRGKMSVVLGGDHSVPFGAIRAYAERHPGLGILHLDAHADLREAYEGFTWSHASIFHNVMTRIDAVALRHLRPTSISGSTRPPCSAVRAFRSPPETTA